MAESSDGQEKTEEPTGKRISDARKKGQLPRSREAGTFFVLISGVLSLWLVAPFLGKSMMGVMEHSFTLSREQVFDLYEMGRVFYQDLFAVAIPLLIVCGFMLLAAFFGNIMVGGNMLYGFQTGCKLIRQRLPLFISVLFIQIPKDTGIKTTDPIITTACLQTSI